MPQPAVSRPARDLSSHARRAAARLAKGIAAAAPASPALLMLALIVTGCAGGRQMTAEVAVEPVLAEAEMVSVARSLSAVPPGKTAPWTEMRTDAVGTARIVGEVEGACLPVEVMRLRDDRLDTMRLDLCEHDRP